MSNAGKFKDRTPFLRVAGITSSVYGACADQSLRQNLYYQPRTSTPEHTRKYRRSLREIPGAKQIHPGIYDDPKDYEKAIHGIKTAPSDHVTDCIFGTNLNGIKYFINEMQEQKYARCQREPLGKSIMRNYNFPEMVREDQFRFGIDSTGEYTAKELIYAPTSEESNETKRLYSKTHGLSDPGEQKNRNYNWYDMDKKSHIFGKFQPREYNGAKKSLITDFLEASYPKTRIVDKRLEDFRQATDDMIGKSKFKGSIRADIDENFVFGARSIKENGMWNMGKCLHGDPYSQNASLLEPDKDLGKCTLHKSKLNAIKPKEFDPNRIFGVPSIRYDLPKKRSPSVNDMINYGNEKDAFELLYPNPHNFRGVDDPDFEVLNTPVEIKDLLEKYEYQFKEEEFNLICEICLKNYPNEEGKISFKSFIDIMRNLKREYLKYRGILNS